MLKYTSESGSIATYVYYVINATWHNFAVSLAITYGQKFSRIKFSRKAKKLEILENWSPRNFPAIRSVEHLVNFESQCIHMVTLKLQFKLECR